MLVTILYLPLNFSGSSVILPGKWQRSQSSQAWQKASWNPHPCLLEILANLHHICSNGSCLNSLDDHKKIFLHQPK